MVKKKKPLKKKKVTIKNKPIKKKKVAPKKPELPSEYYERLDTVRLWQAEHLFPALGVSITSGLLAAILFGLGREPGFNKQHAAVAGSMTSLALGTLLVHHALKKRTWKKVETEKKSRVPNLVEPASLVPQTSNQTLVYQ